MHQALLFLPIIWRSPTYLPTWTTSDHLNSQFTGLAFSRMTLSFTIVVSTVQGTATLTLTGIAFGPKCVLCAGNFTNILSTETFWNYHFKLLKHCKKTALFISEFGMKILIYKDISKVWGNVKENIGKHIYRTDFQLFSNFLDCERGSETAFYPCSPWWTCSSQSPQGSSWQVFLQECPLQLSFLPHTLSHRNGSVRLHFTSCTCDPQAHDLRQRKNYRPSLTWKYFLGC